MDRGGGADNFRISPIARWARPPGDAIDFGATVIGSLLVTPPGARDPGDGASLAAPITNANESARGVAAVALASAARPVQVAIAACDAQPAIVPLPVQLEKSTPPLVPADRAEAEYRRGIELHERARQRCRGGVRCRLAAQRPPCRSTSRDRGRVDRHGRSADAERILGEGLALSPQPPQLGVMLARIQAERHDMPAAIDTLRSSLRGGAGTASDQAEALALMATLQQGAGQHREAVDAFAAALRQMPQNGAWWIGLGISLAAEGRHAGAREALERARATPTLAPELLLYVEQRLRATTP